jgi:hypothetical protein
MTTATARIARQSRIGAKIIHTDWRLIASTVTCEDVTIEVRQSSAIERADGRADGRVVAGITRRLQDAHPGATVQIFGDRLRVTAPRATFAGGRFDRRLLRSLIVASA